MIDPSQAGGAIVAVAWLSFFAVFVVLLTLGSRDSAAIHESRSIR
jgi:hypothetical protein